MDTSLLAWLAIAAAAISNGMVIWNFIQSPSRKNETQIAAIRSDARAVDDKVDGAITRIAALEITLHQMPDKDSMHRLEIGLERMRGEIGTLSERLKPIDNLSRRLQEVLLEKSA